MNLEKLILAKNQNVFIVFEENGIRSSLYGGLESVQPSCISIRKLPELSISWLTFIGDMKVLKIYDKQGFVIYDGESSGK